MWPVDVPEEIRVVLDKLVAAGHEAYFVGGCVRDAIIGVAPHDWDICTSATPEEVQSALAEFKVIETGLKHGTLTVFSHGQNVEVTTYRKDGTYSDGRHPDAIAFTLNLADDLSHRDFTMNAMAYSPQTGLIDPFGGRQDIRRRLIRCVGDPAKRLSEDRLRTLRAVRLQATTGFDIEDYTQKCVANSAYWMVDTVSKERIGAELEKMLKGACAARAIEENQRVVCAIIPELRATIDCQQNNQYHKFDVFGHTLDALSRASDFGHFGYADTYTRFALLFHDIGKPICKTTDQDGYDHFYGHPAQSAKITEQVLRRLRFSNDFVDTVTTLVAYHDVAFTPTKPAARRLLLKLGETQLRRLIKLRECDALAHTEKAHHLVDKAVAFSSVVDEVIAEQSAFSLKDLAVNGNDLVAAGIPAGPEMGRILQKLLDAVIGDEIPNEKPALLNLVKRRGGGF